jgi:hypothetical protein
MNPGPQLDINQTGFKFGKFCKKDKLLLTVGFELRTRAFVIVYALRTQLQKNRIRLGQTRIKSDAV